MRIQIKSKSTSPSLGAYTLYDELKGGTELSATTDLKSGDESKTSERPYSLKYRARNSTRIPVIIRRFKNVKKPEAVEGIDAKSKTQIEAANAELQKQIEAIDAYLQKQKKIVDLQRQEQKGVALHPSLLPLLEIVRDGTTPAAVFANYDENLVQFKARHKKINPFLTPEETLLIFRQLTAGVAMLHSLGIVHERICNENIVLTRNGQNQWVFKIADLMDKDLFLENLDIPKGVEWDIFDLGVVMYQLIAPDADIDIKKLRLELKNGNTSTLDKILQELANPEGEICKRFSNYPSIPRLLQVMLDRDTSNRPIVKNIQIELSTMVCPMDQIQPSVANEPIVPAGEGDFIVKQAQAGDTEAQYQLALLLRERGHKTQTRLFCAKAAEKKHAAAEFLMSRLYFNGEGGDKDLKKAEELLASAAEKGIIEAQEQLTALLFDRGEDQKLLECLNKNMSISADALAYLAIRFPSDRSQELLLQAANKGSALAELYSGQSAFMANRIGQRLNGQDTQATLATVFALLPDKYRKKFILSSQLKQPDAKDAALPLRCQLQCENTEKKETEVKEVLVQPLQGENITEMFSHLIRRLRIPKHAHLQQPVGVCADVKCGDGKKIRLSVIEPCSGNPSVTDYFNKPENRGKSQKMLVPWAVQLAHALEKLHANHLIHGNLTARSTSVNPDHQIVLEDFKHVCYQYEYRQTTVRRDEKSRLSNHIPPEADKTLTPASDIYALGMTLFEMAMECSSQPYEWSSDYPDDANAIEHLAGMDFQAIANSKLPSHVPAALKNLILQCLSKDPSQRPSAHQLVEALSKLAPDAVPAQDDEPSLSEQLHNATQKIFAQDPTLSPNFVAMMLADAANFGDQAALDKLVEMLWEGTEIPEDRERAIQLCLQAARQRGADSNHELYQIAMSILSNKPNLKFLGLELLTIAADAGHQESQQQLAERLWDENEIVDHKKMASSYLAKVAKINPDAHKKLEQKEAEFKAECKKAQDEAKASMQATKSEAAAQALRMAFQHFFGLDVPQDYKLSQEYLEKAANESKQKDPNGQLARAILSLSAKPLDGKSALRFFVPGDDFKGPFVELDPTVYRVQDRAFRCSIVGRSAVIIAPKEQFDAKGQLNIADWLNRNAHAHPNVVGPIGSTAGVSGVSSTGERVELSYALLYPPIQADAADRKMFDDPATATSRLLPFLVGVAEGLAHLHRSNVEHGNVSIPYMLVGQDRSGLIAVCPHSRKRATAPESLERNVFSSASDVFDFGCAIAFMLTGGWENSWLPEQVDIDSKTRLARLTASAANGYQEIRDKVPKWCPQPLVDIMMRCLNLDPMQRPSMGAIAEELQKLRTTLAQLAAAGPQQAQYWMHTSHICQDLLVDDTYLRYGGIAECLYGPRIRDRLRQSFNPDTNSCRLIPDNKARGIVQRKSFGIGLGTGLEDQNLAPGIRKVKKYKDGFFQKTDIRNSDGTEAPDRGITHFESWARGAMLLEDKKLIAFADHLDNPPKYQREKHWCNGKAGKCKCERAARPKNAKVITGVPPAVLRQMTSFMDMKDYAALAGTCRLAAQTGEGNTMFFDDIIKRHGDRELIYIPRQMIPMHSRGKKADKKENKKEDKKEDKKQDKKKDEMALVVAEKKRDKSQDKPRKTFYEPMVRRWGKVIGLQQVYAQAHSNFQGEIADISQGLGTKEELNKKQAEYKEKRHACGCCRQPVMFGQHFDDKQTQENGGIFMACNDCKDHNVWSTAEASTLWGFTAKQLERIPHWCFGGEKFYLTDDLSDARSEFRMLKKTKENGKKIDEKLMRRAADLPDFVRENYVRFEPEPPVLSEDRKKINSKMKETRDTLSRLFTIPSVDEKSQTAVVPGKEASESMPQTFLDGDVKQGDAPTIDTGAAKTSVQPRLFYRKPEKEKEKEKQKEKEKEKEKEKSIQPKDPREQSAKCIT